MKKMVFILLFFLCLSLYVIDQAPIFQNHIEMKNHNQNYENQFDNEGISKNTQSITIKKEQIYQGKLLLINSKYPIHKEGIKSDIVNLAKYNELINGYGLKDANIFLSKEMAEKFSEMVKDAEKEGVSHYMINSGYRNFDEQNRLYHEMGASYALPAGYSEHNSGLSLDVGSSLSKMEHAPEGKWLENNAWKYGFILRYPKDKTKVTGIQYEPWHIRYVGLPHSVIMKEKNFALEEYLEYLKEKKSVSITIHGKKYEISYYPVTKDRTIHVPSNLHYEISGNNMDGIIVTMYSSTTHTNVREGREAE
jgi:zinc D-Ala-D-Ala carboxypeptidase